MTTPLMGRAFIVSFSLFFAIISFTLFVMKCVPTTTPLITMHNTHFTPYPSESHAIPT